jgi:RNase adaptor protein for sRNA GlmZ degradation
MDQDVVTSQHVTGAVGAFIAAVPALGFWMLRGYRSYKEQRRLDALQVAQLAEKLKSENESIWKGYCEQLRKDFDKQIDTLKSEIRQVAEAERRCQRENAEFRAVLVSHGLMPDHSVPPHADV